LDSLLVDFPPPRLVKLDVEGFEMDVLLGASRVLQESRPVWIVEVHGLAEPVVARLESEGYKVSPIGKGAKADARLPVGGPVHFLAVPRA
jgi:hypothetical protein